MQEKKTDNRHLYVPKLAFAKFLIREGYRATQGNHYEISSAILNYHDAVEIVLNTISKACDIDSREKKVFLLDYWKLFHKELDVVLPDKQLMAELNDARIDLKHQARFLTREDCIRYYIQTNNFINQVLALFPDHIQVRWDEISNFSLVESKEIVCHLKNAEAASKKEAYEDAFKECSAAYAYMERHYLEPWVREYLQMPDYDCISRVASGVDTNWENWVAIEQLRDDLKENNEILALQTGLITLRVDMKAWVRYKKLAPIAHLNLNDEIISVSWTSGLGSHKKNQTAENVQFCIDFVFDCCLRIQEHSPEIWSYHDDPCIEE